MLELLETNPTLAVALGVLVLLSVGQLWRLVRD